MTLAFQFLGPPQLVLENEPVNMVSSVEFTASSGGGQLWLTQPRRYRGLGICVRASFCGNSQEGL